MRHADGKIIIAGGGIGGLAAAVSLRQEGFEVSVFEQADELREIGAGLSVWPNATWVLNRLGLLSSVLQRSEVLRRLQLRNWRGEVLSDIGAVADFETPSVCIHRADLLSTLKEALPAECLHLGERIDSFMQRDGTVIVSLSGGQEVRGDALIGADGLNSTVRAQFLGRARPTYRGYWAWRGIAHFSLPDAYAQNASETWGRGLRFGIEPMTCSRVFWYATANAPEGTLGDQAEWKEELSQRFDQCHRPIPELIQATDREAILKHEISDRPPVRRWGEGRVTLLGDAAHPTTPNLGQGGCMAIEDAFVLAHCLAQDEGMSSRLRTYESLRFKRTEFITRESRRVGWMGQVDKPLPVALRSLWLKLLPASLMAKRHRLYYSWNAGSIGGL